jgi:hypothetical protein
MGGGEGYGAIRQPAAMLVYDDLHSFGLLNCCALLHVAQ